MKSNQEAREMARELVGDGQTPNLWFVTHGPFIIEGDGDNAVFELIEGYDPDKDTTTMGPFASYAEARACYDETDPDYEYGIGQVFIEDRLCGTVTEKYLEKIVKIDYSYVEHDDSKLFYKNK